MTAARPTLVILRLPWTERSERLASKAAAKYRAEQLARSWTAFEMEVVEDEDGDYVVREVSDG